MKGKRAEHKVRHGFLAPGLLSLARWLSWLTRSPSLGRFGQLSGLVCRMRGFVLTAAQGPAWASCPHQSPTIQLRDLLYACSQTPDERKAAVRKYE